MDKLKKHLTLFIFNKWAELDLNQRRRSQRIYSPPPLTTRASTLFSIEQATIEESKRQDFNTKLWIVINYIYLLITIYKSVDFYLKLCFQRVALPDLSRR